MAIDDTAKAKLASDLYFDATNTIRHYDTQRVTFSSLSISALAFLTGFSSTQAKVGGSVLILRSLALLGFLLAALSTVVVAKLGSLIKRQRIRARSASHLLETTFEMSSVSAVDDAVTKLDNGIFLNLSLSALWIVMFLIFAIIELLAAIFSERLISL